MSMLEAPEDVQADSGLGHILFVSGLQVRPTAFLACRCRHSQV